MARLKLSLLGPFQVLLDGKPITTFESNKVRALLAYLAAERQRPQPREALAELLWPDWPPASALSNLRHALAALRTTIHDRETSPTYLLISRDSLQLNRESDIWVDAWEFDRKLSHPQPNLNDLKTAVDLYPSLFMGGFSLPDNPLFEEWLAVKREAYQRGMLKLLGLLVELNASRAEYKLALPYAYRQLELEPWLEEAHQEVMRLLALSGQRSAALAQFETCRKALQQGLGVEPGAETLQLFVAIRDGKIGETVEVETQETQAADALLPTDSGAPPPRTHNLPAPPAGLVGRQPELEALCDLLINPDCRLVTVLGAGGSGKSRLALEAGRTLLPGFPDGVFWVELDTFQTVGSLAPLVCNALDLNINSKASSFGVMGNIDLRSELFAFLRQKKLLLILDSFEGMLSEADLVACLLRSASQFKILVTSRVLLNLQYEHVFPLEGLNYPLKQEEITDFSRYSALQLFEQAARQRAGNFILSEDHQPAVVEICSLLEGLPLGILLAASWTNILTPEQILMEFRRSLDLLSADWHDLPERQHSLTATFDYSFSLLPEPEQISFLRLSVFNNPFTPARAAQVVGVSLHTLKILVEQSLLQRSGEDRFRMHDLLRQYAMEKLAATPQESHTIHQKHSQVLLEALAAWEPRLIGPQQLAALDEMDPEYLDFLFAWEWAVAHAETVLLDKAVKAFYFYHNLRFLYREAADLCDRTLNHLESLQVGQSDLHLWLWLKIWQWECLLYHYDYQALRQIIIQIEDRLPENIQPQAGLGDILPRLTLVKAHTLALSSGDRVRVLELLDQALQLGDAGDDPWELSMILKWIAEIHFHLGNLFLSRDMAESALALLRTIGDLALTSGVLTILSYASMLLGDCQRLQQLVEEQNAIREQLNCRSVLRITPLAHLYFYSGQYLEARPLFEEALHLYDQPENRRERVGMRRYLNLIDLATGKYESVLNNAAYDDEPLTEDESTIRHIARAMAYSACHCWSQAEQELVPYFKGFRLDMLGLPLAVLGYCAYRRGENHKARGFFIQALENGLEQGHYLALCFGLAALAVICCETGDLETGAELFAIASAHPSVQNFLVIRHAYGQFIEPLLAQLPPGALQSARERGLQQTREQAAQEWLERLRFDPNLLSPHA